MNKNTRIGRIKYVVNKRFSRPYFLFEAHEYCEDASGNPYTATYNLWLTGAEGISISKGDVGRWAEIGFYIQSFRLKELTGAYETALMLKSLRFIDDEDQAKLESKKNSQSIIN